MQELLHDLSNLLYPKTCIGCNTPLFKGEKYICFTCHIKQPTTALFDTPNNLLEKALKNRFPFVDAAALFLFKPKGIGQKIVHHIKYRHNKALAFHYGKLMGQKIIHSNRFQGIDGLMALPSTKKNKLKRGFNQSLLLAKGIAQKTGIPIIKTATTYSNTKASQTKFNRINRWHNLGIPLHTSTRIKNSVQHILLVDDVVTTGATLESFVHSYPSDKNHKFSVASLAYTTKL